MEKDSVFAETLHVKTRHGLFRYGATKEDLKDNSVLVCGPAQAEQILNSDIPCLTVLLEIESGTIEKRAKKRGDHIPEIYRRMEEDYPKIRKIRNQIHMILNAKNTVEENAACIMKRLTLEHRKQKGEITGHIYSWRNESYVTAQPMSGNERHFYMEGDYDLRPYLRMKEQRMPKDPVEQIAWLLLQVSGGCGFCKTLMEHSPCDMEEGNHCINHVANYIRQCVHEEKQKEPVSE